jgi:hypothetical protein
MTGSEHRRIFASGTRGNLPSMDPQEGVPAFPQWAAPAVHQKLHKPFCRSFLERNHRTVSCRVMAVQT